MKKLNRIPLSNLKKRKTAGNMSNLKQKSTQKPLKQLNRNYIINRYPLYKLVTLLAISTSLRSTPSTQFSRGH